MTRRSSTGPTSRDDQRGPRLVPIPKADGATRWLTRLDPAGDVEYRRAVTAVAGRIERSLGPEVLAPRARRSSEGWRLRPWPPARARWRASLRVATDGAAPRIAFAVADVRDCFGSITPGVVERSLGPEAARAVRVLRRLHDHGVHGLPVGPEPSAILANAALRELDGALRVTGVAHVRWVDDLALWGSSTDVRRGLDALNFAATRLGLELHDGKTRILSDRDELRALTLEGRDSSIIAAP
ncbi:MAG TPA: RNA-directed DNA polymerase [Actinomycetota bacterium]|nr:RNA-directed DNA polymerase [Actinomycetota bacterium]